MNGRVPLKFNDLAFSRGFLHLGRTWDAPERSLARQAELPKRFNLLSSKIKTLSNKRYFAGHCSLPKNRNV
jgi:hypothetical protein